MGHTHAEWRTRVGQLLRDVEGRDWSPSEIDETGIRPALGEHTINRARLLVVEVAGNSTGLYDLPAGWEPGISEIVKIEAPARQIPPCFIDRQTWQRVRKTGALGTEQILLDVGAIPLASYVRWWFTGAWPFPTDTADDDPLDDLAYGAVTALAASLCCTSLSVESARRKQGTIGGDFGADNRPDQLQTAARTWRAIYLRYLGIDQETPNTTAPVSIPYDFDPQTNSLFHGGRR